MILTYLQSGRMERGKIGRRKGGRVEEKIGRVEAEEWKNGRVEGFFSNYILNFNTVRLEKHEDRQFFTTK